MAGSAGTATRSPIALTIAGSDSSGGAGIQADLKTFAMFSVYGASVLTALTAQNTRGVQAVAAVEPSFVAEQIASVMSDLDVAAIKTGMLANAQIVTTVARALSDRATSIPLVIDPVMVATSGDALLTPDAVAAVKSELLPLARLLTPNLPEAARLLDAQIAGSEAEIADQGRALLAMGCHAVLMKGGHGEGDEAVDLLVDSSGVTRLSAPRLAARNTHGTGCTLSAAIAALLALGMPLEEAVRRGKDYVHRAIASANDRPVGHGHGPVDHLYALRTQPPPA